MGILILNTIITHSLFVLELLPFEEDPLPINWKSLALVNFGLKNHYCVGWLPSKFLTNIFNFPGQSRQLLSLNNPSSTVLFFWMLYLERLFPSEMSLISLRRIFSLASIFFLRLSTEVVGLTYYITFTYLLYSQTKQKINILMLLW